MKDPLIYRIKKNIFCGLGEYKERFPFDFDIWQIAESFVYRKDTSRVLRAVKGGLKASNDFLLYIQLPFCFSQCRFCSAQPFKSNREQQEIYIKYLIREAEFFSRLGIFNDSKVSCFYFGGGTTTGIGIENLERILHRIRELFIFKENCDITCETHPVHMLGKNGLRRIKLLEEAGINRISMGVQSFDNNVLNYCHRCHTAADAETALSNLKESGMRHNIDMMIGLPGQTVKSFKKDLLKLEKLEPDEIEYFRHEVINKKAINLYKRRPDLWTGKDALFEMNWLCQKWMEENGYEQNGYFLKNSRFFPYRYAWLMERPYLGLGSGAVSYFNGIRFVKIKDLSSYFFYLDKEIMPIWKFRILTKLEQAYRSLLLRMQTKAGIKVKELKERFGINNYNILKTTINKLKDYELVTNRGGVIKLTDSYGRYFLEDIFPFIMNEARKRIT